MPTISIPIGAKSPYQFRVLLSNDAADLDPVNYTLVTDCQLEIRDLNTGAPMTLWTTTLSAQTTSTATATRVCSADGLDFVTVLQLNVRPVLTLSGGGERLCNSFTIQTTL